MCLRHELRLAVGRAQLVRKVCPSLRMRRHARLYLASGGHSIRCTAAAASPSHSHSTAMGDSHVRKDIPRLITLARRDVGSARAQLGLDRLYYNTIGSLWLRQSLFPRPRPSPTCLLLLQQQQRNLWHATRICICISAWLSPSCNCCHSHSHSQSPLN